MSKIEELIEKLCPNGVEYKTIGEVATYRRGSFPQPYTNSLFYGGEGAMPFVQVADIEDSGFKLKEKTKQTISKIAQLKSIYVPKETVICSIQGTIGRVAITQYDSYIDRTIAIFESFKIEINKRFFAYCIELKFGIEKQFARGSTLKTITKEEFTKFSIPVPPLEVQCEIVHILDDFTLLSAELSAELKARKKQYEYYKNSLLNINGEKKKLGEIANFKTGSKPKKIFEEKNNNYFEYINAGTTNSGYVEQANFRKNAVTTPSRGQGGIGFVGYQTKDFWLGPLCYAIYANDDSVLNNEYLYYELSSKADEILKRKNTGGVPSLNGCDLKTIPINIPPINEQIKIVKILNKFEKLCNDISEGLPAEIEARQKQYEYYRDKLLTFKELKVNE